MCSLRHALLGLLISTAALADRPAAVQVCLALPDGVALYATAPQANYRQLAPGTWVLDLDVTLNGRAPERLTRDGASCLRAWLPARHVTTVAVNFDRTMLNLAAQSATVDLKLKPDLWYQAGALTVSRDSWATLGTSLPGTVTLERLVGGAAVAVKDLQQVPAGTYRLLYEAPPLPVGPCRVTLRATGVGSVRADNKPAVFGELVEMYRTDWLPEVLVDQKLLCTRTEALEVHLRIANGVFQQPRTPELKKVRVAEQEPRYVVRLGGEALDFQPAMTWVIAAGQQVRFDEVVPEQVATGR